MKNIITTTYKGPDLDGYGCAMAYAELLRKQGRDAVACVWGKPQLEVLWLIQTFHLPTAKDSINDVMADVVLLDASSPEDLPTPLQSKQVVEIIDHRKIHKADEFPNAKQQIELVGAAATLVAERFVEAHMEPSKESALFLLGGIISNTQNFTGIATDRDRAMADWLWSVSGVPADLARQMFLAKSNLSGSRLKESMFIDLKTLQLQEKRISIVQLEIIGVQQLVNNRREEMEQILKEIHTREQSDFTFINMKDLDSGTSMILCLDQATADLLKNLPGVTWNGLVCQSAQLTLRKQLSSWIQNQLTHL